MIYRVIDILTHHYLASNSDKQILNLRSKTDNVRNGLASGRQDEGKRKELCIVDHKCNAIRLPQNNHSLDIAPELAAKQWMNNASHERTIS